MKTAVPPLPRLAETRTDAMSAAGFTSLIKIIYHLNIIIHVRTGGNRRHVVIGAILEHLRLKGVCPRESPDGLCLFRAYTSHRYLA